MNTNTVKCEKCGHEYPATPESYNKYLFKCWECGKILCIHHSGDEGAICEQCGEKEK